MNPSILVRNLREENLEDVFQVCSHARLQDPLQRRGMELKRRWLLEMLSRYGPCTKVAYLEGRPIAQLLYYPEEALPYVEEPRRDVIRLHCIYNPFPEARGRGAASALLRELLREAEGGMEMLGGKPCRFIAAKPFNTGEGIPLEEFYASKGFRWGVGEMYLEVAGAYEPREAGEYRPLSEDEGRAIVFYSPLCEYSYPFAVRVAELIREVEPSLPIELIDMWRQPLEARRGFGEELIVNARPIRAWWGDQESFKEEIRKALKVS